MNEIELRHLLHQRPELAFEEFETQKILIDYVEQLGYQDIRKIGTGIVVVKRSTEGPYVLLRAEMDGLPIVEQTGVAFRSQNNFMHACGHDFHMASVCWAMRKVLQNNLKGNFLFLFQPAEESGAGAIGMLKYLQQNDFKISAAIAMHVTDEYEAGMIASRSGVLFSASCEVDVLFKGVAAHAAFHQYGKDAMRSCVDFLDKLYHTDWGQDLVWFGKLTAGSARNIVADSALIQGTIRSEDLKKIESRLNQIEQIAQSSCDLLGTTCEVIKGSTYRQVEVDERLYMKLKEIVTARKMRFFESPTKLTAEDFGYFSQCYPTLMYWFGTKKETSHGLHSPWFLPSDDLIEVAGDLFFELLAQLI